MQINKQKDEDDDRAKERQTDWGLGGGGVPRGYDWVL